MKTLELIQRADARIPNNLSEEQKLQWMDQLEQRLLWELTGGSKTNAEELLLPDDHPCFGIYEEYLCMQLSKHLCDAERYRLAESAFKTLWAQTACYYKKIAPYPAATVRGL